MAGSDIRSTRVERVGGWRSVKNERASGCRDGSDGLVLVVVGCGLWL